MTKLFYSYLVVDGMPDVVQTHVDTHDIGKVIGVQTSLPKLNEKHSHFKLFMNDVGPLCTVCMGNVQFIALCPPSNSLAASKVLLEPSSLRVLLA